MAERSRRDKKPIDKFAAYKLARQGGSRTWQDEADVKIYDEVDESQYKAIVKGRLQRDDFVVDDGVGGYMDDGHDDWASQEDNRVESDEEDTKKRKKSKKKAIDDTKTKPRAPPPPAPVPSISAYRPQVSAEQEDEFMSSILDTMKTLPPPPTKSRKRKSSPPSDGLYSGAHTYRRSYDDTSSDGPMDDPFDLPLPPSDDLAFTPRKKVRTRVTRGMTPDTERMSRLEVQSADEGDAPLDMLLDDVDMDAFMKVEEQDLAITLEKPPPKKPPVPSYASHAALSKNEESAVPSWLSVYDSLSVTTQDTLGPLAASSAPKVSATNISALEADGSLRFFWMDYLEHNDNIFFVGKLRDKNSGAWVSCCVTVEGLQRNLFILPRDKRVEPEDGDLVETDIVPEKADVYQDFDRVRSKFGIKKFKAKFVKRKYAFGERDVPREERDWLKVVYGFDEPQIPASAHSPNFSRIFGTNTSAFELLVLKRKIMGPCWLQIKNPTIDNKGVTWCKFEVTVTDPKDINPFSDSDADAPRDIPPLTVMSLSVRTIVNHKENQREIVCVSSRVWSNLNIDDPTPPEQLPCSVQTFVRPLDKFPPNFEARAKANGKGTISSMRNERMLLGSLLSTIQRTDPDVIVGHDFLGVSLDVLLHRMKDLKVDHWSRFGRFRRSKWPMIGKQGTNMKFLNGRLICDLASDGAKGMITSTTWSLTEMCKTYLKNERQDIDPDDTANYMDGSLTTPDSLLTFVRHCELDAHYHMAIAAKVQLLPLTKQLTNLAGNSWNKTLNGGRAERNEYILLHEFHRLKYICPDKAYGKKSAAVLKTEADEDDQEGAKTTKGKRDKYKGGLVFEPRRGLWDKYILVMDFNSLYPSIIQEYNIDFTTVDKVDDEDGDKIPEPPPPDVPQGVLPRLIATLVNRRRVVKALMKDKTASHAQLLQYDIKQMALKLTANSMYGCLGFEYSRFYARPLAALTTFKGREILTHTRELAESLHLDVVYGDTDSVFVNSNVTDLAEALKISSEFKKAVNDRYRLLEIDLDGVFQRLLLLQKKKYAAIKVEDGKAGRTSTEVKGLDMKRREYCVLSKNVSQYVLEQILSGEATEIVVERIHEYLSSVGEDVRAGKIKLDDFIVFKRLGKNPEDYPDAKNQPHVQVALRMKSKGGNAKGGDVIPYIFCIGDGEEPAKSAQADRAKHPEELRKAGSELKIDYEHYLSHQVLPPIERLCEPIEGTDRARLAECLGLDPSRYRSSASGDDEERTFFALDSQISDAERYKEAKPFTVRCRSCEAQVEFRPIHERDTSLVQASGPGCLACKSPIGLASLQAQLEVQIRERISKYYEGWTVCDDPTCGNRTRMMSVYGRRCLRNGCRGRVTAEYSDARLYNQLRFYGHLFDAEKALKVTLGTTKYDEVHALTLKNAAFLQAMGDLVGRYLDQNGRRWVDLNSLFSFMRLQDSAAARNT